VTSSDPVGGDRPGGPALGDVGPPGRPRPEAAGLGLGALGAALGALGGAQDRWPPDLGAVRTLHADDLTAADGQGGGLAAGAAQADALADAGVRLLVVDGASEERPDVLVLLAALLSLEPVAAVGTDPEPGWAGTVVAVRDGLPAARRHGSDVTALLDAVAAPRTAVLAGLLARSALRRTPVLLDGRADVVAAALLADRLCPGAAGWWLAGATPARPAARRALDELGLPALLDLGLRRPGGASLAFTVLRATLELAGG